MWKVDSCCCYFSVSTAGKIIGCIQIVLQIAAIIVWAVYAQISVNKYLDALESGSITAEFELNMILMLVAVLILYIINIICCIFLIKGAYNGKASYVKPYLIINIIATVFITMEFSIAITYYFAVLFYVLIYFWFVVLSYYMSLIPAQQVTIQYSPAVMQGV